MKPALVFLLLGYLQPAAGALASAPQHVALVVQHSGAHRSNALAIIGLLNRLVETQPEAAEFTVVGFAEKFEQLEARRFRRKPAVLLPRTADREQLRETLTSLVFHGPSPVYDAVLEGLNSARSGTTKPGLILLISSGVDNASETDFEELLKQAAQAAVPVVSLYFPVDRSDGGDGRLRKLAKATGGKFIDVRAKDSWDQLLAALR